MVHHQKQHTNVHRYIPAIYARVGLGIKTKPPPKPEVNHDMIVDVDDRIGKTVVTDDIENLLSKIKQRHKKVRGSGFVKI